MTKITFISFESKLSEWREKEVDGRNHKYKDIIIRPSSVSPLDGYVFVPETILPENALVYVKNDCSDDSPWLLARYDGFTENIEAHLIDEPNNKQAWPCALIPHEIITDVTQIASAEGFIAFKEKESRYRYCEDFCPIRQAIKDYNQCHIYHIPDCATEMCVLIETTVRKNDDYYEKKAAETKP